MSKVAFRRSEFKRLHHHGCFVVPNPWDLGSARYLETLGFQALATTSAGFAFSQGLPDDTGTESRDRVLRHLEEIVAATNLPVNADFQAGYGTGPEGVAESVRHCVETGVAGLSIEDATGNPERPLFELAEAVDRLTAAKHAMNLYGADALLTGRAECFLVGHPDPLSESIRRLQAYAEAGADVLYAPGVRSRDDIAAIVSAVKPKPVNVLIGSSIGLTVADLAELGVRRISVGGALARAAWTGFMRAAKLIAEEGSFEGFRDLVSYSELNSLFENVAG